VQSTGQRIWAAGACMVALKGACRQVQLTVAPTPPTRPPAHPPAKNPPTPTAPVACLGPLAVPAQLGPLADVAQLHEQAHQAAVVRLTLHLAQQRVAAAAGRQAGRGGTSGGQAGRASVRRGAAQGTAAEQMSLLHRCGSRAAAMQKDAGPHL
jgi:hypothetical protein